MGTKMEVESGMWQTAHQTAWWVDWDQVTLASRAREQSVSDGVPTGTWWDGSAG